MAVLSYKKAVESAQDADIRARVHCALVVVAINVKAESLDAMTQAWYDKRQYHADRVLDIGDNATDPMIIRWAWVVATTMDGAGSPSDAELFSFVSATWDKVATVSATDKVPPA